jgi:hypothetical protein
MEAKTTKESIESKEVLTNNSWGVWYWTLISKVVFDMP